ncbi:MAG TPA: MFS transporter [Actinomycetospora sp.]|nr:MFS transporter [Actinomycetospora sp.]
MVVAATAGFLVGLDTTALNVALPAIGRDLHASLAALQAVVTVFALSSAALLTAAGLLADRWGRRRVFLAGVLAFGAASAACAAAPSVTVLVAARISQGAGAAVVTAAGLAVLAAAYSGADRDRALGSYSALAALSFVVGPLVGGALTELAGWRVVFLVNVPVAALIALVAARGLPESHASRAEPLDVRGIVTFSVGLAALNVVLLEGEGRGWTSPTVLAAAVAALAALAVFVRVERGRAVPAVDLRLFRHRAFAGGALAYALGAAAFFGLLTYLGLFLQGVLGFSPVDAGLAFLPFIAPYAVAAKLAGALLARVPRAALAVTGLVGAGIGMVLLTVTDGTSTLVDFVPGLVVLGAGAGLMVPTVTSAALSALPPERLGVGSGLLSTVRPLGVLLGTGLLGLALRVAVADGSGLDGPALAAAQAGDVDRATALSGEAPAVVSAAFVHGFHAAALVGAALVLLAAVLAGLMLRGGTTDGGDGPETRPAVPARSGWHHRAS